VEKVYQDEEQQPNEPNFEAIDPQAVARTIEEINEALKEKEIDPKVRQKLNYARKNWPGKLADRPRPSVSTSSTTRWGRRRATRCF